MKRLLAGLIAVAALSLVGATARADDGASYGLPKGWAAVRVVDPKTTADHIYAIPPKGTSGYCFQSADPDRPASLPTCPNMDYNGTVAPDPNVGPAMVCPQGEREVIVNGQPACGRVP